MRRGRLWIATAAVALVGLAATGEAAACTCRKLPPSEMLHKADAAFVGTLVGVAPATEWQSDFRYRVQRVYKPGPGLKRGAVVSVRAGTHGGACGLSDQEGRQYGLFLGWGEGRWYGSSCGLFNPEDPTISRGAIRNDDLGPPGVAKASCAS